MKRLIFGCSLFVVFTFFASMQCMIAQSIACPHVYVLSKNLTLDTSSGETSCMPCMTLTKPVQKINMAKIKMVLNLSPNIPCDETLAPPSPAPKIPDGSKLTVSVWRIVRNSPIVDSCNAKNAQWGSFYNIGNWTITYKGSVLFSGDIYRGTVGTCAHMNSIERCCGLYHEEVYMESKGTKWHFRAMGVIQAYYNMTNCKYLKFEGKLDGVISEQ